MSGRKGLFLAIGAVAGFVAGVCFAPKEGSETRKDAKEKLMEVMEILQKIEVKAPISMHQVIVENVLNLGINIIATREVKE